jgi:TolB-like protein
MLEDLQRALGPTVVLGRELPRGGMSRVFVAQDQALQRKIAVKVLAPELAQALSIERFRREIMVIASLQHPNIVPVLSAGEAGGLPFFVMPFIEGESLRARLMRGPLSVREAIGIMRDMARALSLAHERGIVHRDVKPDNVMLTGGIATVTDFGVAKALDAARDPSRHASEQDPGGVSAITREGTALGTPTYMAPEQAAGEATIDHRVDLYALGIVGYEMLTGAPPFQGRSVRQLMAAQLGATPTPIETRRAGVPAELRALIMQCLEKDPAQRPRSASSVVRVLESPELASGAIEPPTPSRRRARWLTRVSWIAVAALAAAGVAYAFWPTGITLHRSPVRATVLVPALRLTPPDSATSIAAQVVVQQIAAGLSRMPQLRVAGPPLADSLLAIRTTTSRSEPTLTVAGVLQRTGGRTRLTASLVDETGYTIWGDTFEFSETDPFRLEDNLSGAVVSGLLPLLRARLKLPPQ